ncbi:NaeI family type II restriction endonuclease [Amycolatopsis sp. NPDC051373]|uniref:NaeI family type II restriction endonuclease n=1 Tax=Amycolatopsis sp. NPDC051373 TaxID=3155801 RepID=UPI00344C7F8C
MTDVTADNVLALWGEDPRWHSDPGLDEVAAELRRLDPEGQRFAKAIRRSIDMLLDGQHTGRYSWDQLYKTEKTHAGTLIEINLQREFGFDGGDRMDYSIIGHEVDCKFSQSMFGWMIPPEARDHLLLVVWASDQKSQWSAGLVRASAGHLNQTGNGNRDGKRTLSIYGKSQIRWLFSAAPLQENLLLKLDAGEVEKILEFGSGQKRLDELFRRAQGRIVSRNVVATVAKQDDYMKRVRGNGGARQHLKAEGIVILGDYRNHVELARALSIAEPGPGEFVSVKLRPQTEADALLPSVELDGDRWVVAPPNENVSKPAPNLPSVKK